MAVDGPLSIIASNGSRTPCLPERILEFDRDAFVAIDKPVPANIVSWKRGSFVFLQHNLFPVIGAIFDNVLHGQLVQFDQKCVDAALEHFNLTVDRSHSGLYVTHLNFHHPPWESSRH